MIGAGFGGGSSSIVYAATQVGIYRSTDAGATWSLRMDFGTSTLRSFAIDPSDSNVVYVGVLSKGVYRSSDGGLTFALVRPVATSPATDGPYLLASAANGSRVYYLTEAGRIFRSDDAGASWPEKAYAGVGPRQVLVDPTNPDRVLVLANSRINCSLDGGSSWTALPLPAGSGLLSQIAIMRGTLWLSAGNKVYATVDDGVHWADTLTASSTVTALASAPSETGSMFAVTDDRQQYRFTAGAWTHLSSQTLNAGIVRSLSISPADAQHVLIAATDGVFGTSNGGAAWAKSDSGIVGTTVSSLAVGSGRVYGGTGGKQVAYASDESGWQELPLPDSNDHFFGASSIAVHPTNPNIVMLGGSSNGLFRTHDGGAQWTPATGTEFLTPQQVAFDPRDPTIVYSLLSEYHDNFGDPIYVYRSIDGGASFTRVLTTNYLAPQLPSQLVIDPSDTRRVYVVAASRLYRTLDSGTTWQQVDAEQGLHYDVAVDGSQPGRVYAAAAESGIRVSDDAGATWSTLASFTPYDTAYGVVVDPNNPSTVYALSEVLDRSDPDNYRLQQVNILRSVDRGASWERIPLPALLEPTIEPLKLAIHPSRPGLLFASFYQRGVQTFQIRPDLGVSISGTTGASTPGSTASFDVTTENTGTLAATGIKVSFAVPASFQNVTAGMNGGSCTISTGNVECKAAFLRANEQAVVHVQYVNGTAGSYSLQATASMNEQDKSTSNNAADAVLVVAAPAPDPVAPSAAPKKSGGGGSMEWLMLMVLGCMSAMRQRPI